MLNLVQHNKKITLLVIAALISITMLVLLGLPKGVRSVSAQDKNESLEQILHNMEQMMSENPGFLFTLRFINPIDEDELVFVIGDPQAVTKRAIHSIGQDNVCFNEDRGGTLYVRCIPFYNIRDIGYIPK